MAEKVLLFELDINVGAVLKDNAELRKSISETKKEIKALSESEDDHGETIEELTLQMQLEQKELRENQKLTKNVIAANKENKGSINALRAELGVVTSSWNKLSKEERENTEAGKALSKQKLKLTNALKKEEKATGDTRRNVGNYKESVDGALGSVNQFIPGLGGASSAMRIFGTVTKFALGPIALLIAAGFALKEFFTSSEEGQDKLNKIMAVFSTILGNLSDVLSDVGELLFETFSNPKQAIEDFAKLVKENIINRFEGLIELIPKLGKAISLLFKGEFAEAGKVATDAVAKVTLGVEDFTNKAVKGFNDAKEAAEEFAKEMQREIAIAKRLADLQANLDRILRSNLVENAKLASEIAEIRAKASEKDKITAEKRLELLDEALKKENEILENNLKVAETQLSIKIQQNALSKSNKEDLDEQAKLEANLFNVKKANFEKLKSLERERQSAINETERLQAKAAADEIKRLADVAKEESKIREKRLNDSEAFIEQEKQRRIINEQNELALQEQNILNQLEIERAGLEAKRQQEIEFAESIGADITLIERKFANAREEINRAESSAKLSLAADFANNIAQIAGEGTAIGKAAAVAATTISTIQSAQAVFTGMVQSVPGPIGVVLGVAGAAAAVVAGIANVKKILAVKSGLPGDTGGGGGSVSVSTPPPPPRPDAIAPTVNQGIISRQTEDVSVIDQILRPTLVLDEVTAGQDEQTSNEETSVI